MVGTGGYRGSLIYFHLRLVDFTSSSLQLSSETAKRYVLHKPDRKLFGRASFRHCTKRDDKAQIWPAENLEHKAMFRTTPNLHVLRERLTRDHKLIGSFTREQEGSGGIMCFAAKLMLAMFRSHIP